MATAFGVSEWTQMNRNRPRHRFPAIVRVLPSVRGADTAMRLGRSLGVMFARDDESAGGIVVEIGVDSATKA